MVLLSPVLAAEGVENSQVKSSPRLDMEENPKGSVPDSDLDDLEQGLENPRIAVHETLEEAAMVVVISPEEAAESTVLNRQGKNWINWKMNCSWKRPAGAGSYWIQPIT